MESIWRDVKVSLRGLRRTPGLAAIAIGTLALGIGAGVAIFSVLDAVVLRPLPYEAPDRLVRVWPTANFNTSLVDLVAGRMNTLDAASGLSLWSMTLVGEDEPEQVQAAYVGADHFDILGVEPLLGRTFAPEEFDPGRSDVAVLSHAFWSRRFGGDPAVLGRAIRLEGIDHPTRTVIGVMPPDYRELRGQPAVWVPLHLPPGRTFVNDSTWYVNFVVARLAPAATVEGADAEIAEVAGGLREEFPRAFQEDVVSTAGVVSLGETILGDTAGTLWLLLGAVGLVFAIMCANLANLLLARGVRRLQSAAIRAALGATRLRLIRLYLIESLLLAAFGGAAAVPLAWAGLLYIKSRMPAELPRSEGIGINGSVLLFAIALALIAAAASGILPALRASAGRSHERLRSGGRWTLASARRLNRALVAAEVALAMILVTAGSMVLRGFAELVAIDPGFDADGVTAVEPVLPPGRAVSAASTDAFYAATMQRISALPGVTDVGAIHLLPLTPDNWAFPHVAEGHVPDPNQPLPLANFRAVAGDYFRALRIPLLRGQPLSDFAVDSRRVGVINQVMARELWPGEDPIGKEIRIFGSIPFTVVGVVGDVRQHALDAEPRPEMYVKLGQWSWAIGRMFIMVRAPQGTIAAPALRRAVWSVDPAVPIPSVQPLLQVVAASVAEARFFASLLAGFGLLALTLGFVGVYGVAAQVTGSRLPDYGIRIALGATQRAVVQDALADGIRPVIVGILVGGLAAFATSRLLLSLFYGVAPSDPTVYVGVASLILVAGAAATYVPARRAGRVDPVEVMRSE